MSLSPRFVVTRGVGNGAYAKDEFGRVFAGVESATDDDLDFLGKCHTCGEPIYIGWHLVDGRISYCYDCPRYPERLFVNSVEAR